jgi:glycosyltransferase involved in cell wall biosynthesis
MKFSLIHPSRSRPLKSHNTISKWLTRCVDNTSIEVIVSLDTDDPDSSEYDKLYKFQQIKVIVNDNRSAVDAVNKAALISKGDILIVVSDDSDCPPMWDDVILKATEGKKDWVLKVNCGIQKRIITMPIMDRAYFKRDMRIYNPIFKHSFSDTTLTEMAHIRGRVIVRNDIMFRHLHYSVMGEQPDALYLRNDATHDEGRKIFQELQKRNFDL